MKSKLSRAVRTRNTAQGTAYPLTQLKSLPNQNRACKYSYSCQLYIIMKEHITTKDTTHGSVNTHLEVAKRR